MKILRSNHVPFECKIAITAGRWNHASGDLINGTYEGVGSVEGLGGKSITINGGDITIYAAIDESMRPILCANKDEIFFTMNDWNTQR